MRVKHITVQGLFGVFDHEISLKLEDRITIIHGPNGFGKTALLRMLQSIFSGRMGRLRRTSFDRLCIDFEDGGQLRVFRQPTELIPEIAPEHTANLVFDYRVEGQTIQSYTLPASNERDSPKRFEVLEKYLDRSVHLGELERVARDGWLHLPSGNVLTAEEVVELYEEYFPAEVQPRSTFPEWLRTLVSTIDIRFIEAQRLLGFSSEKRPRGYERGARLEPAVLRCANEMASLIRDKQSEYGKMAQQLDSSFPARVLRTQSSGAVPVEDLKHRLEALEKQQQRILSAGLLPADDHRRGMLPVGDTGDATTRRILSLYVGDVEEKLRVFDSITDRVETLQRIINERFSYKKLAVDARSGFRFVGTREKTLQPTDLSSGEQHELVLFYELLFKTKENALILIDEPELSLHVAWQVQFLKDLSAVTRLSGFDVLLATHSPQIINDRWDLTVELKGPEDVAAP